MYVDLFNGLRADWFIYMYIGEWSITIKKMESWMCLGNNTVFVSISLAMMYKLPHWGHDIFWRWMHFWRKLIDSLLKIMIWNVYDCEIRRVGN